MVKRREKSAKQSVITSMATYSTTQKPQRGIIKAKTEANLQYEEKMILGHQRNEAREVTDVHKCAHVEVIMHGLGGESGK